MDERERRNARFMPLGYGRIRLLACLGGDSRHSAHYFDPAPEHDLFEAYAQFMQQMAQSWGHLADDLTRSLLAAGALLTGDLAGAEKILELLPAEPFKLDHGAGYCFVAPLYAIKSSLPLPATLVDTSRWLAGSVEQTALREWLAAHREQLVWHTPEGVYRIAA